MKVQDVMTNNVRCCNRETNLAAAVALLWEGNCGVLPVVEDGKVMGIVTDRDICIALGTRNRPAHEITVRDIITETVATCRATDDVASALETMRWAKVRRIPVVSSERRLLGMLSLNDIALRVGKSPGNGLSYHQVVDALQAICQRRRPVRQAERMAAPAFVAHA